MSNRRVISLAAIAALGIACVSADTVAARVGVRGGAVAYRGGAVGYRGGALAYRSAIGYRGWGYRGDYYRPGLGLAAGAIAGGAIAASRPWYGYGGNGYDYGSSYYGYNPGYSTSYVPYPWRGPLGTQIRQLGRLRVFMWPGCLNGSALHKI